MSTELNINALLTETGVNMGDHAQDVTRAVIVDPDMTVREMCDKYLTRQIWISLKEPDQIEPDGDKMLIIRLAVEPKK